MIQRIEQGIREYFLQKNSQKLGSLYFLKYNTPISGTGIGTKVLFFVFENESSIPLCVVKTVRSERDVQVIILGSERLQLLTTMVKNSPVEDSFPQLLFAQKDGIPFSVETFCAGDRAVYERDIQKILDTYGVFAKQVEQHSAGSVTIDFQYAKQLLNELSGDEAVKQELQVYAETLFEGKTIVLPACMQHGDVTPDNIMFYGSVMRMIDCDLFGAVQIPGFDLFHLVSKRSNPDFLIATLTSHFHALGITSRVTQALLFVFYVHELYIKKDYILQGKTSKEIIEKFEEMVVSRL